MRGITEKRYTSETPPVERITINHRKFINGRRPANNIRHLDPTEIPIFKIGEELAGVDRAVPIFAPLGLLIVDSELRNPIDQRAAFSFRGEADRITNEFLLFVTGHHHRAARQEGRPFRCCPPEHATAPNRVAFVLIKMAPHK